MEYAYLLINCEHQKDEVVQNELSQIPGIKDVTRVFGAYDLIAKIEAATTSELKQKIMPIVKNIVNIRSALTLKSSSF